MKKTPRILFLRASFDGDQSMNRPCFPRHACLVLAACACLLIAGCLPSEGPIDIEAPLSDPKHSAVDDTLTGEWKQGGDYLLIRPYRIEGAPPGLMQFKWVLEGDFPQPRPGTHRIEEVQRGYFTVSTIGTNRYANICGEMAILEAYGTYPRREAFAEVAGKGNYERWMQGEKSPWLVFRYQVRDDRLTIWTPSRELAGPPLRSNWKEAVAIPGDRPQDAKTLLLRHLTSKEPGFHLFNRQWVFVRANLSPPPTAFRMHLAEDDSGEGLDLRGDWPFLLIAVGVVTFLAGLWWLVIGDSLAFGPAKKGMAADPTVAPGTGVPISPTSPQTGTFSRRRSAVRGLLAALAGALVALAVLLAELFAIAGSTHLGWIAAWVRLRGFLEIEQGMESCWFLGLAMAAGILVVVLKARLARPGPTAQARPPTRFRGRLARHVGMALLVLAVMAAAGMVMTRARSTLAGWFRGETCYRGLPASYWVSELGSQGRMVAYTDTDHPHLTVYKFFDETGYVKVLRRHIGKDSVPGLLTLLDDPHPPVRQLAVITLARLGPAATEATPALLQRLDNETDQSIRRNAMDALELIDPEAVKKLAGG
jgi:hypothetical protein